MSLKERISDSLKKVFKILGKFPITLLFIGVLTLFLSIFLENNYLSDYFVEYTIILLFTFISGTFVIEVYFKDKVKTRAILYFVSYVISVLFLIFYKKSVDVSREYFERIYTAYISLLYLFSIFTLFRNSKLSFERYFIQVVFNTFKVSIVYNILMFGIMMVTSLFSFLLLGDSASSLIWRVLLASFGLIYVPGIIYSFINKDEKILGFVRFIVKYIMTTILILAFTIIYLYMLKILVLRQIPSNQIFRILAMLFVVGLPTWTMCYNFKDEKGLIDKINSKLPILFIPFICLQIYSIFTRIHYYGFTMARYVCVMFLLIEVIYIIIYIINKKKIHYMFMIVSALIFITLLVPGINMFDVSYKSQLSIIKKYIDKEVLTNSELSILKSSYRTIEYQETGIKYLEDNLTDEENTKLRKYLNVSSGHVSQRIEFTSEREYEAIKIDGYKTMQAFDQYYSLNNKLELKNIDINEEEYDLSKAIDNYIGKRKIFDNYFNEDNNNEIIINSKIKIVLTYIDYFSNDNETTLSIRGYVLKK